MKIWYLGYENCMWKTIVIAFVRVVAFGDQLSMKKIQILIPWLILASPKRNLKKINLVLITLYKNQNWPVLTQTKNLFIFLKCELPNTGRNRIWSTKFWSLQGWYYKKKACKKKYMNIQGGLKLRKPLILMVNWVSSCLSFFLSASTAATYIFPAPTCTTTIITLSNLVH